MFLEVALTGVIIHQEFQQICCVVESICQEHPKYQAKVFFTDTMS